MGRSNETFGKKEVRNKQIKKRKDKENRRLKKKESGSKSNFEEMLAWVDENGVIRSTPPDSTNKEEIKAEDIEVATPKAEFREARNDKTRTGKVKNYDDARGFGFIYDSKSNESFFVHANDCLDKIKTDDAVVFKTEKGPKGLKATEVKLA